jgi:hypothetical protein
MEITIEPFSLIIHRFLSSKKRCILGIHGSAEIQIFHSHFVYMQINTLLVVSLLMCYEQCVTHRNEKKKYVTNSVTRFSSAVANINNGAVKCFY